MMRQRGAILVVVLWFVATLALLVAALNTTVFKSSRLAKAEDKRLKTEALLGAGLEVAAARLLTEDPRLRWTADGRGHDLAMPDGLISIRAIDAGGLIDINRADEPLLVGLLQQFTSKDRALALAEQITDRRTPDTQGPEPSADADGSADEDDDEPRVAAPAFMSLSQLQSVPGFNRDLISQIVPFTTVHSVDGRINSATAPVQVLASLPDISSQEVAALLDARRQGRLEDRDAQAIRTRFERFLRTEIGPVYVIRVEVHGDPVQSGYERETAILVGAHEDRPFHILGLGW
jgi:general secretion pathway protein K